MSGFHVFKPLVKCNFGFLVLGRGLLTSLGPSINLSTEFINFVGSFAESHRPSVSFQPLPVFGIALEPLLFHRLLRRSQDRTQCPVPDP